MKLRTLAIISIFWFISLNGFAAAECNTKLTKDDRYDELNKTLQCLSTKLHALEQWKTIQEDNNSLPRIVEKTETRESNHIDYVDDYFQVTIKSCTKNRKNIHCVLKYKNIPDTDVGIGFLGDTTYLIDNNGERWDYSNNTAIKNGPYNRTGIPPTNTFNYQSYICCSR